MQRRRPMTDVYFMLALAGLCALLFHVVDDPMSRSVLGISAPIFISTAWIVDAINRLRYQR